MSLRIKDQHGVGALGVVAVIIVLAVVGFTGWFVYKSQNETNSTIDKTTDSGSAPQTVKTKGVTTTVYSKVPVDLQKAIVAAISVDQASCVKDGKPVDADGKALDPAVTYDASGFAEAGIGCDGPHATMFAKADGKWETVGSTQFAYKCADLEKYKVPLSFMKELPVNKAGVSQDIECVTDTGSEVYKG